MSEKIVVKRKYVDHKRDGGVFWSESSVYNLVGSLTWPKDDEKKIEALRDCFVNLCTILINKDIISIKELKQSIVGDEEIGFKVNGEEV